MAEYLLLDEIQYTHGWQTWLKHQVDFEKRIRIAVTGSAVPLETENLESGAGRWHTIRLATLSFSEYLQIQEIRLPNLPEVDSLAEIFSWKPADLLRTGETARPLVLSCTGLRLYLTSKGISRRLTTSRVCASFARRRRSPAAM